MMRQRLLLVVVLALTVAAKLPCGLSNVESLVRHLVVFNRVPKVGSTSLLSAFHALRQHADIHFYHSRIFNDTGPAPSERVATCLVLKNVSEFHSGKQPSDPRAIVFDKHMRFANFNAVGLPHPPYINFIREPVQRLVSWSVCAGLLCSARCLPRRHPC
jgi:hypothetical protein